MKNIRENLKMITEFEDFVKERAFDLIEAKGCNMYHGRKYKFYFEDIDYDLEGVSCWFKEDTPHDCPEIGYVSLTITDLEMVKDQWDVKIMRIKNDVANAER